MVAPLNVDIDGIFDLGTELIKRIWRDPSDQDRAKLALLELKQSGKLQELISRTRIIQAEAESEHWLAANWRPLLMLTWGGTITVCILCNMIIFPLVNGIFGTQIQALGDLPEWMGVAVATGITGYIGLRSLVDKKGLEIKPKT